MAATDRDAHQRIELVVERRRAHGAELRSKVVAESRVAGARVRDVARRHGICPSLVYRWRRCTEVEMAGDVPTRLVPVQIAASPAGPPATVAAPRRTGLIEIELTGGVRLSVDEAVSLAALRRVMSALRSS